jgi:hypothetical protein
MRQVCEGLVKDRANTNTEMYRTKRYQIKWTGGNTHSHTYIIRNSRGMA